MKFGQLAHGASFEFRGIRYRKISAIEAINSESGQRKLIPRSAQVIAIDVASNVVEDRIPETVNRSDLEAALANCAKAFRQRAHKELLAHAPERIAAFEKLLEQTERELRAELIARSSRHGHRP